MISYFRLLKDFLIIFRSGLFDPDYYHYTNPDVYKAGINPLLHFLQFGHREGRNPSPYFDTKFYLSQNQDVEETAINPLTHWILFGRYEGRDPSPNYSSPMVVMEDSNKRFQKAWLQFNSLLNPKKREELLPTPREFSFIEDKTFIDKLYFDIFDKPIDYENPHTFTEKMQIYKLYYRNQLMTKLTDKIQVREYITNKVGKEYLVPLIGHYEKFDEIPIKDLPQKFVLKTNHGSGWNIICWDKDNFDWDSTEIKLNYWLGQNYYWIWREWNYKDINPKILVEELLLDDHNNIPTDYKIYCFNGQPKMILVRINENSEYKAIYYDMDWQRLPFHKGYSIYVQSFPKPKSYAEMIDVTKKLAQDFPFVRVDLYSVNNKIYVGELTFLPDAGLSKFHPPEWDNILGSFFDISMFYKYN